MHIDGLELRFINEQRYFIGGYLSFMDYCAI